MLEGTAYNLIKDYSTEYLYGFDKDQLNLDLLKGNVSLKRVNLRPEKINEVLTEAGVPAWVKSGMLTNLN
jgi:hypothetical protein